MLFRPFTALLLIARALLCATHAAPVYELIAEFERPGAQPLGRISFVPADGNYYGTTTTGGAYNRGTVFRMTPAGVLSTLVSFAGTGGTPRGDTPDGGVVRGPDGALYGVTPGGGTNDFGTVFKVTTAGVFATLVDFSGTLGTTKGAVPNELIFNSDDGNFYGTTQAGGAYDFGTVFRMTPAGAITTLVDFTDTSGARKGSTPIGALAIGEGTLYGATQTGGSLGFGAIYKYALGTNTWTLLAEFTGTSGSRKGSYPSDGLTLHPDGMLYGTTEFGGANDFGTVFRLSTIGANFISLKQFADTDGAQPAGQLLVGADNLLYGTTSAGGANGSGTVFKITTGGTHTLLAEFSGTDGDSPLAGLSTGANGELYGTTSAGGAGYGTIYKLSTTDAFSSVASFNAVSGWQPSGGPVLNNADVLVPMKEGGVYGSGTLLRCSQGGGISVVTSFGGTLGVEPVGALLQSGDYYGVTRLGGTSGRGTFFRYIPGTTATTLTNLNSSGGARPEGPVIAAPDGNFYCVATEGGSSGRGAVLCFTPAGARSTLVSFTGNGGAAPGGEPHGPLACGADGNFYGATEEGGANGVGTLFKVTPLGVLTVLTTFAPNGPNSPLAGLTAGPDGNFYGTTERGGSADAGTVFSITPAGEFTVLCEFTGKSGARPGENPAGPLLAALDGTLYGMTDSGGATDDGTVYKITPAGTFVLLGALTNTAAPKPGKGAGALNFLPDGSLFGVTPSGGPRGGGTIFRFKQLGPHAGTDPAGQNVGGIVLRGRVQTGGEITMVSFEYGPTATLGSTISLGGSVGPSGSPVAFNVTIAAPPAGQTIYYRAKAANPSGTSSGVIRTYTVPAPYAAWKVAQFGDPSAPDFADPDCDGVCNLAEYALLLTPTKSDAKAMPALAIKQYAEGARLRLMIPRDPSRTDVTIEVQAASNLIGPWTSVATSANGAPFAGPGYVTGDDASSVIKLVEIRDIMNVGSAALRFMRIRVTH